MISVLRLVLLKPAVWCIAVGMIWLACAKSVQKEQINTYKTINPFVSDTIYTQEYVAEIQAIQNVEIRSRMKGFIETILVDEGQYVSKGQTLFKINNTEYQQTLAKTKAVIKSALAELKAAEIEAQNAAQLLQKNIIGSPEYEMAKAKAEAAKASVEEAETDEASAQLQLTFTEIKAPFSGRINRLQYKTGSLVEEGNLLTTLSDTKEVFVYFNVSESDYLDYLDNKGNGKSKEVSLQLANGKLYSQSGWIETTENEFDPTTGTIAFRARFPNPNEVLKHGASGKVLVKTTVKNAVLIPQLSTFEIQGNIYVYTVSQSSRVEMRQVIPSFRLPQVYVIRSGLAPTDHFIYEGIQSVKEGDTVRTEKALFSTMFNP
jgi:RND family efflux transporter MFP subunit